MPKVSRKWVLVLAVTMSGCGIFSPCGETRSVFYDAHLGTVEYSNSAFDSNQRDPAVFEPFWKGLTEGESLGSDGVALHMDGTVVGRGTSSISRIVLVLPTPLTKGKQYSLGSVIAYRALFGSAPLTQPGKFDIGLWYGHREFKPGAPIADDIIEFEATSGTGTITVTNDSQRTLTLRVSAILQDATGQQLVLDGDFTANGNVETNACFS